MENSHESFWQFSDQLRLQTSTLANLSINDTIWGNSLTAKKPEERKNFDVRVGAERINSSTSFFAAAKTNIINQNGSGGHINGFNNGWKTNIGETVGGGGAQKNVNIDVNGGFNKGVYSKFGNNKSNQIIDNNNNYNNNNNYKNYKNIKNENVHEGKVGKKNNNNNNNNNTKSSVDKRFKTLPASESLPRNEAIGGYIFVCNNDTMEENLRRQLFGLPPRYRDSVRAITPGLPLFLYNYSTHQLHGIFEASSFGGTNIDPMAWEDKKSAGESRFPAQVRAMLRKLCEPLEEDSFRPILHHYDGPKFRLELNIPEALALLDIFSENNP